VNGGNYYFNPLVKKMMRSTEETTADEEEAVAADEVCASCGKPAVDDVKLMKCACNLVKYCSVDCQKNHRSKHKKMCKKRLAELRDRDLFTPPEGSHLGDCPICCLPLPLDSSKSMFASCCSKSICMGCNIANQKREFEAGLQRRCAFCREPAPKSLQEADKRIMKRIKDNNDPAAIRWMGAKCDAEGDHKSALEYLTKAAELGVADAHYSLSCLYHEGEGVEKDMKKAVHHWEEAAIGGHLSARHNLGCNEVKKCRFERAKKHFIIAANLGVHASLECLKDLYKDGHATKEDYADALRAYQAAVGATKSAERKKAEEYYEAKDAAQQR